jgi:hypothetical protein
MDQEQDIRPEDISQVDVRVAHVMGGGATIHAPPAATVGASASAVAVRAGEVAQGEGDVKTDQVFVTKVLPLFPTLCACVSPSCLVLYLASPLFAMMHGRCREKHHTSVPRKK